MPDHCSTETAEEANDFIRARMLAVDSRKAASGVASMACGCSWRMSKGIDGCCEPATAHAGIRRVDRGGPDSKKDRRFFEHDRFIVRAFVSVCLM